MPRNQVFIISWAGQHANACLIADALADANVDVYIVFSDPNPVLQLTTEATVIRRDDHLFAGDKLQACMEAFDGDHLFVICADCTCDDWVGAVKAGVTALADQEDVWIWAPHIHHSGYGLQRTAIMPLPHTGLTVVAHTDTIVFGWKKPVVERIRKSSLGDNLYGWGIGWMAIAFTYTQKNGLWLILPSTYGTRHHEITHRHRQPHKETAIYCNWMRMRHFSAAC